VHPGNHSVDWWKQYFEIAVSERGPAGGWVERCWQPRLRSVVEPVGFESVAISDGRDGLGHRGVDPTSDIDIGGGLAAVSMRDEGAPDDHDRSDGSDTLC